MLLLAGLGLLGAATAQSGQGPLDPAQKAARSWVLVDECVGMVGGDAVAFSVIRPSYERYLAHLQADLAKRGGGKLGKEMRRLALWIPLAKRVESMIIAEHAKTLGSDPASMASRVQSHVDMLIQREKDQAGSNAAFFKNLEEQGLDFREYENEMREKALQSIVMQETMVRLERRAHLLIRPRQILSYYRKHQKEFRTPARAKGLLLRIRIRDREENQALDLRAQALADKLRAAQDPEAARSLAEKAGAQIEKLDASPSDGLRKDLLDFLFAEGPARVVSEPLAAGNERWIVLRSALSKEEQKPFASRRVQELIRNRLLEREELRLRRGLLTKLLRNAQIWPEEIETFSRLRKH